MAQTAGIIKGRDVKLFIGSGAGVVIDDQLDLTLNIQRDIQEITTKQSSGQWKEFMYNFKGATGTVSCYTSFDATEGVTEAFSYLNDGDTIALTFSTGTAGNAKWTCSALVTEIPYNFPKDGPAGFSINFTVTGAVTEGVDS